MGSSLAAQIGAGCGFAPDATFAPRDLAESLIFVCSSQRLHARNEACQSYPQLHGAVQKHPFFYRAED